MASVYNLEPQPTAKLILHTTSGDLLLELFAQQTPKTSRNFIQLCLDGYYDNTIFHRLVPGFIVQGGDPTGTGAGGESSFEGGRPFEDEFHSRLKFNRRGLLGMANTGDKDDNGSQFFLTLGATPELTGRNTMFGRVEGETIFNLVKMGEADLVDEDGSERPLYPTRVTGAEILVNPFEGMVGRVRATTKTTEETAPKKRPAKKKAAKQLLSFGGDDGQDGDAAPIKMAAKFNPKLVAASGPPPTKRPAPASTEDRAPKRRVASRSPSPIQSPKQSRTTAPVQAASPPVRPTTRISRSPTPATSTPKLSLLETTNAQIAALKNSLKRNVPTAAPVSSHKTSALEAMIPSTSMRGRKRKGNSSSGPGAFGSLSRDEQRTVDEFTAFKRKLDTVAAVASPPAAGFEADRAEAQTNSSILPTQASSEPTHPAAAPPADDDEAHLCDLHFIANCQSCSRWDEKHVPDHDGGGGGANAGDEEEEKENEGWMAHQLSFAKDRLGKDLEWKRQNERELVVIDPREKERELVGGRREGKGMGRGRGRG